MPGSTDTLLDARDLIISYDTDNGVARAVNGVSFTLRRGETLGLVGETGAGKTTTALAIMGLLPEETGRVEGGSVLFEGEDLLTLPREPMRRKRGQDISMVFQDPMTALNPVMNVGEQIAEALRSHQSISVSAANARAGDMLEMVGIPRGRAVEYPHQFSGGMKQRVVIAIALVCRPKLLIADEPTTALDVTIQAQVLELIARLKTEIDTSMLLITHDLGVVARTCQRVAIMYSGRVIEMGTIEQVFDDPLHPYTHGLFGSIPDITRETRRLTPIDGLMPDPFSLPEGCAFAARCRHALPGCCKPQSEVDLGGGHMAACWRAADIKARRAGGGL
ncbi:MAG: ABC transporter ATP-binding protein [Oscillospiraceae bacterium]|nr:ABC transporter ATP-binding protein [Oscillospiraceae bacterium]